MSQAEDLTEMMGSYDEALDAIDDPKQKRGEYAVAIHGPNREKILEQRRKAKCEYNRKRRAQKTKLSEAQIQEKERSKLEASTLFGDRNNKSGKVNWRKAAVDAKRELAQLRKENKELKRTKLVPAKERAADKATIKFLCEALDSIARATDNKRART